MQTKTCDFLLNVHTLPNELEKIRLDKDHYLYDTAQIYQRLIDTDMLWKVWQIDEYGSYWVEINLLGPENEVIAHTLIVNEDTYDKIDFEEYTVL